MIPNAASSNDPPRVSVYFVGRVFPDVTLTIPAIPKIAVRLASGDLAHLQIKLQDSELRVHCEVQNFSPIKFWDLTWAVSEICHGFVDLAAFTNGVGLAMILDKFIGPDATEEKILPQYPDLKGSFTVPFSAAFKTVIENWQTRWTFHDLTYTLRRPNLAAANCARAIERVAKSLQPNCSTAQQWAALRNNLRCSQQYLMFITDVSKSPRHGGVPQHSNEEIYEARRRSWVVVNRYLEFLNRGGKAPLPATEFPIL